ncbi:MAG: hypothetical protein ACOZAP_04655 [Pseudomonadota bacterium]
MTPNRLSPSRVRFWKRRIPTSLRAAVDESLAYAKEAHNLNVEQIAERMSYGSHWNLYKQLADLNLKLTQVRAFEHACGIDLLSRYYAASAGRVVIEVPAGRAVSAEDMQALQLNINQAVGALLEFYAGQAEPDATLEKLTASITELAWHRENVRKHASPELQLEIEP